MDRQTERKLIEQIKNNGCVASFSQLIKELHLYRDVFHFVKRYLNNPSDTEEVTQESMFRAFHNVHGFDPDRGRFRSWVFGIAAHQAYDRLNERKFRSLHEIEDLPLRHTKRFASYQRLVCKAESKRRHSTHINHPRLHY